ncbi:MAG: hypothetical protein IJB89_09445 [Akkermansia sp.]|nr:hypothetical protein [Akkermansia sp.]
MIRTGNLLVFSPSLVGAHKKEKLREIQRQKSASQQKAKSLQPKKNGMSLHIKHNDTQEKTNTPAQHETKLAEKLAIATAGLEAILAQLKKQ